MIHPSIIRAVRLRAEYRCEYCLLPEGIVLLPLGNCSADNCWRKAYSRPAESPGHFFAFGAAANSPEDIVFTFPFCNSTIPPSAGVFFS